MSLEKLRFHRAEFIKSAVSRDSFPERDVPHIVFAGKSNVGKSSVINRLVNRKNFARVGSSPGKTVHINFFLIDGRAYFVDLPGYGYARVSKSEKQRFSFLIEEYFNENLMDFGVFIVDARHAPTSDDMIMADWFLRAGVPFCVIANKADKLKKSEIEGAKLRISETLGIPTGRVIMFSAISGTGLEDLTREINSAVSAFDGED